MTKKKKRENTKKREESHPNHIITPHLLQLIFTPPVITQITPLSTQDQRHIFRPCIKTVIFSD